MLWKYFVETPSYVDDYKKEFHATNCVAVGISKLDNWLEIDVNRGNEIWNNTSKKRVVYAPHHSFFDRHSMATFHKNGLFILDLAQKNHAKVFAFGLENGYDISDYTSVEKALNEVYETTKHIDYVVNSAGLLKMGKLLDRKIEDIHKEIDINYMGSIHVCKASIPYLKESKGSIALFASSSYTRGRSLYSTYSSTKAGIVNLTQALAEELCADNIRINVMSPERTATPMRFAAFGKEPEGSLLQPEVVAETTLKVLLSNLTGQVIDVRRKKG